MQQSTQYSNPSLNSSLNTKNRAHADRSTAFRLTQESYISPEMQWDILSFLGKNGLTINTITGAAQDFPPMDFLLQTVNSQLQYSMTSAQKESMKNALHAMLEATGIALFVASTEAAYQNQQFLMYPNINNELSANLNAQKQAIQTAISAVQAKITVDQPAQESSYFSWFFGSSAPTPQAPLISSQTVPVNTQSHEVTIPADLMPTIIKMNSYKEMSADPVQAANLLFKQCFIAQQHHLKDLYRIEKLRINLQSPVSATNYIFTHFPDIYNKILNSYPICQIAQNLVPSNQYRVDLKADLTNEQIQAHQLLLHIRQAIQTALYIANEKSSFNIGNLIPSSVISYLDGITSELTKYDTQLSLLCKDPRYGATLDDVYQDEQWAMITKVAAGVVVTAVAGGALYAYAPSIAGYVATNASNWVPSWLGGSSAPIQGPQLPPANQPIDQNKYFPEPNQPSTFQTIGQYAGTAAQYAETTKFATGAILFADKSGFISTPGALNQSVGGAISIADTIAGKTVAYGSAIKAASNMGNIINSVYDDPTNLSKLAQIAGATGAIGGALGQAIGDTRGYLAQLTNNPELVVKIENDLKLYSSTLNQVVNKYNATNDVYNIALGNYSSIFSAGKRLYNAYFALNPAYLNIANYTNPSPTPNTLAPDKLYTGFARMIEDIMAQRVDMVIVITNASIDLLRNKKTDQNTLLMVLQKLQQDYAPKNQGASKGLGQIIQNLAGQPAR